MRDRLVLTALAALIALSGCGRDAQTKDQPWYHASDVTLLATTGRPQLVEFFHPN